MVANVCKFGMLLSYGRVKIWVIYLYFFGPEVPSNYIFAQRGIHVLDDLFQGTKGNRSLNLGLVPISLAVDLSSGLPPLAACNRLMRFLVVLNNLLSSSLNYYPVVALAQT